MWILFNVYKYFYDCGINECIFFQKVWRDVGFLGFVRFSLGGFFWEKWSVGFGGEGRGGSFLDYYEDGELEEVCFL